MAVAILQWIVQDWTLVRTADSSHHALSAWSSSVELPRSRHTVPVWWHTFPLSVLTIHFLLFGMLLLMALLTLTIALILQRDLAEISAGATRQTIHPYSLFSHSTNIYEASFYGHSCFWGLLQSWEMTSHETRCLEEVDIECKHTMNEWIAIWSVKRRVDLCETIPLLEVNEFSIIRYFYWFLKEPDSREVGQRSV